MAFIISADDCGVSKGVTDTIFDACDNGSINSVSIIPNGDAFDYAIEEYKKRRERVRLAIHLNFLEGKPISSEDSVYALVDDKGKFNLSFLSIIKKTIFGPSEERAILARQLKLEIESQINKVRNCFISDFEVNVDSHQHFHAIPFVFDLIFELVNKLDISYIRLPEERLFFQFSSIQDLNKYIGPNIIKNRLLNFLSKKARVKLELNRIKTCDSFVGVLFSGDMSVDVVKSALSAIAVRNDNATIEILFHPGGAAYGEESNWDTYPSLRDFYYSPNRRKELAELKKNRL